MNNIMKDIVDNIENMALPPQTRLVKEVCSWCKKVKGYKPRNGAERDTSHGICKKCGENLKAGKRFKNGEWQ